MILYSNRRFVLAGAFGVVLLLLTADFLNKPRALAVSEVPIAFWAWRTQAPTSIEIRKAFAATNAETLFLRAGQFDLIYSSVERIRPVTGALPSSIKLHLVYNGTRRFFREWDLLTPGTIAQAIADTYRSDLSRAHNDHVEIRGLQLDFDVPERLLPQYAGVLRLLRELLPPNTALSITGLPAWIETKGINSVLANVDFWVPQCYGAKIPTNVSERIPISSSSNVEQTITKVRQLNKPFYAGLSAYSYAILYAKNGGLLELRGDIDPTWAAQNSNLELIETNTFRGNAQTSEMRYVYRAKSDVVLDGLIIQPGEMLVFDLPNAASLRASARAVREHAGKLLLGICIFRMPTEADKTALSVDEIATALGDTPTRVTTTITVEATNDQRLTLHAKNAGNTRAMLGDNAFTIDLKVAAGSIVGVTSLTGFTGYETRCVVSETDIPQPCSAARANIIRLRANSWLPGNEASVELSTRTPLPQSLPAVVATRVDEVRIERESFDLQVQSKRT